MTPAARIHARLRQNDDKKGRQKPNEFNGLPRKIKLCHGSWERPAALGCSVE
jgi:hypothetical protein